MLFWLTYRRCCRKHSICWCHTRKQWKQMDLRWSSHHSNWSKPSRFQEKKHDIEILKPSCVPCSLRASSGGVPMLVAGALGWWLSLFYAYPVHGRNLDFITRIWGNGLTTPIPKNQVLQPLSHYQPNKIPWLRNISQIPKITSITSIVTSSSSVALHKLDITLKYN